MKPSSGQRRAPIELAAGSLGPMAVTIFVVAAAAPLLVMAGLAPLAIQFGGIGAPSGYLIAGVTLAIFASGFTAMAKHVRNAGAFYAYIARGLGPTAGIVAAVVALVSYNAMEIGMFGAFGGFAHLTVGALTGFDAPWWVWALAGVVLVWFLGSRSIHVGSQFLITLLAAETGVLVLLAVAVLIKGGAHGLSLTSFTPAHTFTPALGAVLTLAFGAFMGFESTALYREEAKTPDRTIPRATYAAVAFLALFYTFMVWIAVQAYGPDAAQNAAQTNPAEMYFIATQRYVGEWARTLMEVLILTSIIASLLAFHNAITRYGFALAREGILPTSYSKLHPRHLSPYRASADQSLLAAAVIVVFAALHMDPITQLLLWVNSPGAFGIVLLQVVVAVAVLAFFRRNRRGQSPWRVVVAPSIAAVLLATALALMVKNVALLTGASPAVNIVVLASIPATVIIGLLVALRLKRSRPDVYRAVGCREVV
ncbi:MULTISPECIES: APC family permease [unclassified Mycolicibacterium]|uniref:APC family permease n=1 Tax=unclassified Mycolicibacterium TaxID=2636767 RepID=UPI002EDA51ED